MSKLMDILNDPNGCLIQIGQSPHKYPGRITIQITRKGRYFEGPLDNNGWAGQQIVEGIEAIIQTMDTTPDRDAIPEILPPVQSELGPYFSNCCGVRIYDEDQQRCPKCQEHCTFEIA